MRGRRGHGAHQLGDLVWSISDPRIDLTWLTYFTDEAAHPAAVRLGEPTGSPSIAEIIAEYEAARGERVTDLHGFAALTRYNEAAVTSLLIKRARRGHAPESLLELEAEIAGMIADALALLRR